MTSRLTLSGEIPRTNRFETGDPKLLIRDNLGELSADPLHDDFSLYLETDRGLVIILGCAHAGLLNIIAHAQQVTRQQKIHLLLGGTHLKFCSEEQLAATLDRLEELDIDRIGVSHCTGLQQAQQLAARFGRKIFHATVGTEICV